MTDSDTRMVWIRSITGITATARQTFQLIRAGRTGDAARDLPDERVYPLSLELARRIGAEPGDPPPAHAADGAR